MLSIELRDVRLLDHPGKACKIEVESQPRWRKFVNGRELRTKSI